MAENSKIEWTDHTFNPWVGCTKVSEGCKNCYAEELMDKRYQKVQWGPQGTRVRTSAANWKKPLAWNRAADKDTFLHCTKCGWRGFQLQCYGNRLEFCPSCDSQWGWEYARQRVFCASLADVFEDRPELVAWRSDLLMLIQMTPNLDWLLLTKRPENVMRLANESWQLNGGQPVAGFPPNVWIGTSVENQEQADKRIPELLKIWASVRFLSMEPLLGPVELPIIESYVDPDGFGTNGPIVPHGIGLYENPDDFIHWVIVGGESGRTARPMHPAWARSIRDQCQATGVPFLFKQWGEYAPCEHELNEYGQYTGVGKPEITTVWATNKCGYYCDTVVGHVDHGQWPMKKVGKHAAGRLLDGREWSEFPTHEVKPYQEEFV